MKTKFVCPVCGKTAEKVHSKNKIPKFCSRACANKADGRMTPDIRRKISAGFPGPIRPNFKGGFVSHSGNNRGQEYFYVWVDPAERAEHPTINKRGYMHRSHYVWNTARPNDKVQRGQVVHHINGDALDDRIENLCKVQTQRDHLKQHHADDWKSARNKKRGANGRYK